MTHTYVCEVCDKTAELTEDQAQYMGWDYPPFIGNWGVISPRTCGDCHIEETAWWALITSGENDLTDRHYATIQRILAEVWRPETEQEKSNAQANTDN